MKLLAVVSLALVAGGMISCVTKAQMEAKYSELEAEWRVVNASPSETPLPLEVKSDLESKATEWAAAENARRLAAGAGAAGKLAAGDIVGGILALLGLGSVAVDSYKGLKGANA